MLTDTRKSKYSKLYSVDYGNVRWTGGFWNDAVTSCAENMVPQLQHMFDSKEISHVVENFKICAGVSEGDFDGTVFGDGDFYKWMESELYSAIQLNDQSRIDKLDEYIELIAASQQPDGYLSTKQIIESRAGIGGRLRDINEFEVYNMGHMFTSACLHKRLTGKDNFLNVAKGCAKYLRKMYDDAEASGDVQTAVCPSHYMGLIEMYRTTGDEEYLNLAQKAIELRDMVKNGMDDNQDRIPLKQHEKMIGHAVRATYLYGGVADLYLETGDKDYLDMMHKVWDNMINTKIYITGGIGALYNGTSPYGNFFVDQKIHQAFGYEYQLPNITAYNETCANIGLVMWAYRMFLIEPKAEYFDVIERVMLNTNLASVSLDGKKYFYENMLRRAKKLKYELIWSLTRSEYILSYCCPPNLARNIMQSGEYAYTLCDNGIWTGLYGDNEAKINLKNGTCFTLKETTNYPYSGSIKFTTSEVEADGACDFHLRIPKWCESGQIVVNGKSQIIDFRLSGSYTTIQVDSVAGLELELVLDMPVRFTIANGMVEEDIYQAAIEKGPLVYCIESVDADGEELEDICFLPDREFSEEKVIIDGRSIQALTTVAEITKRQDYDRNALYQRLRGINRVDKKIRMIPYFAWDNRGMGEMRIWFPYR